MSQPNRSMIEAQVSDMMRDHAPGDIVQALMDLGATICRPRQPLCEACPLQPDCSAAAAGEPEAYPRRRERKARAHRYGVAWWTVRDRHVWLVRRPSKGLLGGMAALPGTNWTDEAAALRAPLGAVRHVFTHFSLTLAVYAASGDMDGDWTGDLSVLPTVFRKAAKLTDLV